ncbi:hypothetical protein D9615_005278 [Tricholomella constricta]|uniref:Uncharacterized protein n=1 Tax=Tricholomella constricta TaxID=117010 RepID=A0A8H5H6J3_9AGAR|nr:hypothetical protein D9615_005278 [Tricholomella constricta]
MASETSSVSSPSVVPSRTSPSPFPNPTVFSNSRLLQPRVNQISGCCANKVIINLSTALVIPDYSLYYKGPIESFQPTFFALNDGSLVAPPFVNDLSGANLSLLVIGMLTMLFVRNIIVSGDYVRRVKVKRKILFYVLFLSQMLAPVSLIPVIMSSFNQTLDCTIVTILSCVTGTVSLALLITGILGVKAYKCLNNSRIILIILALFQLSSSAVVAMDASTTRGERRLAGSCIRVSDLRFTRIFVWIQLVESLFICCCFLYACWKSRGSSSARGRISIQLSMEDLPIEVPGGTAEQKPALRGWWDYVPDVKVAPTARPPAPIRPDQPARRLQSKLTDIVGRRTSKSNCVATQSPRPMSSAMNQSKSALLIARGTSPTPSSLSRFGKLVPNIHLFQQVIKDELLYTTFITATCVVVAVLAVFGVNFKNGLTVTGWIALNWGIISLLAIHSFGRVIRRHERDALLQRPFTCNAVVRAGNTMAEKKSRESQSSTRPPSRFRREADENDTDDPFADTRRLGDSCGSPSIDPPSPNPFDNHSPGESANSDPFADFPASGHSTPLVAHQSLDGSELVQGFSESWLLERGSIFSSGDEKSQVNMRL